MGKSVVIVARRVPVVGVMLLLGLTATFWPSGSASTVPGPTPQFEDVTSDLIPGEFTPMLQKLKFDGIGDSIGSGLAVFDCDRDGRADIYLCGAESVSARLLRSSVSSSARPRTEGRLLRQVSPGVFRDTTFESGLFSPRGATGAAAADYDADGLVDLATAGQEGCFLFHNEGNGRFSDRTEAAGIRAPVWCTTPVFFDADGDGWLDLLLPTFFEQDPSNSVYFPPDGFPAASSYMPGEPKLFHNNGNGTFSEVTRDSGLAVPMRALGALAADFNADGKMDVYFTCDGMHSFLMRNQGGGRFERLGPESGLWYGQGGEGAGLHGAALYPLPEGLGVLVTDNAFGALFIPRSQESYDDRSLQAGIAEAIASAPGWGCALADLNSDGVLDLFVSRGGFARPQPAEDRVLQGVRDGSFLDVTDNSGLALRQQAAWRACVAADLDNDGGLDIVETAVDRPVRILRGLPPPLNRALRLRLDGRPPNRDAIGARILLRAAGRTHVRQIVQGGYLSSPPAEVFVGLGGATRIDRLDIAWPSGQIQTVPLEGIPRDLVVVKEP